MSNRAANSDIRLKRLTGISHEQIDPHVRNPEMDAGNVVEILDVRLAIEYVQFHPGGAIAGEIPQLATVGDGVLKIEVGRP